jgi:hypothetical protein
LPDVRLGKFAGFDLFMRPSVGNTTEMVLRGQNIYGARVTDTALGTIRSREATVQGFEERAERLGLLKPLGDPARNNTKYFATETLEQLRRDEKWLVRGSDAIANYCRKRNERQRKQ